MTSIIHCRPPKHVHVYLCLHMALCWHVPLVQHMPWCPFVALFLQAPIFPSGLSYDSVSFMLQALDKHVQKRPTVKQLLAHPWFDKLVQQQQQQQADRQQQNHQ